MKPYGPPRPVRSQDPTTLVRGPLLTDRAIRRYAKAGRYGEAVRLLYSAKPAPKTRSYKPKRPALHATTLAALSQFTR